MDSYAVIGNPVEHSKSPDIHRLFAEQTGQQLVYRKLLGPLDAFAATAQQFFADGGRGLNVTVPFKEEAYALANALTDRARQAGAVNTLAVQADGTLLGDNTDGAGLSLDLALQGWPIAGRRLLIIGAGGAVRGVLGPLLAQKPAGITIANRTPAKAVKLASVFEAAGPVQGCGLAELGDRPFDLVINGTSAGLSGDLPPVPATVFASGAAAYDMVYGAEPTVFLQWAQAQGVTKLGDGLGMLVGQAAESFSLWRGVRPQTAPVIAALRAQLCNSASSR